MSPRHTADEWNQRYHDGNLPWDSGQIDPHLKTIVQALALPADNAVLEIGCGTGTNALWLAEQGYRVTAIDVAEKAIDMAREKTKAFGATGVTFETGDALHGITGAFDFVFDRGCFHSVTDDERPVFAQHVADALNAGGWWLSLCGNADEPREEGQQGPPRLTAAHIAGTVEPLFELHRIDRIHFTNAEGPTHLAWLCLARKRD